MILKSSEFLRAHPANSDYDSNMEALQDLIKDTDNEYNSFRNLTDNRSIICITKNNVDNEIQATFMHATQRTSFTQKEPTCFALIGFGSRASAVNIDPSEVFKVTKQKKKLPKFRDLIKCTTAAGILSLETALFRKVSSHAILPPVLAAELFEEENMTAANILLKFIAKINELYRVEHMTNAGDDESGEPREAAGSDPSDPIVVDPDIAREANNEAHIYEPLFQKIMDFLFVCLNEPSVLQNVGLKICTKAATSAWADKQHEQLTGPKAATPPIIHQQIQQADPNILTLASKFSDLTEVLTESHLHELERKKEASDEDPKKKFSKLNPIVKNTIKMFTVTPDMSDEEIEKIEPTESALSLIRQSGTIIRGLLHTHLRRKGCIMHLQIGMCQSLKNLILSSVPDEFASNNLCIYNCEPEPVGEELDADQSLALTEKALLGQLKKEDITLLTKNEKYIPADFWGYEHMLKHFMEVVSFIGGPDCHLARAVRRILSHAKMNQGLYKRYERENQHFYVAICEIIHQRSQIFINSCSEGIVDAMKVRHINYSDFLDDIEMNKFYVKVPLWLRRKNKKREAPQDKPQAGSQGGGNGNDNDNSRNKRGRFQDRGDVIHNNNQPDELKVPKPDDYHNVFKPDYTRGIRVHPHSDGTPKCNNWWYKGSCRTKCPRLASHSKQLTANDKTDFNKYVTEVFSKLSMDQNKHPIPPGLPPNPKPEKAPSNPDAGESKGPT